MLLKDLGLEGNRLPPALKTQLVALALWSMRYSTLAILQHLPLEPLLTVNRNIADGLADQVTAPALPPNTVQTAI